METEPEELEALYEQWTREVSEYPEPRRSEAQDLLDTWRERYRFNAQFKDALHGIDQSPEPERARTIRLIDLWVGWAGTQAQELWRQLFPTAAGAG